MFISKSRPSSSRKSIKNQVSNSYIKYKQSQITKKITLAKSQLKLKDSHAKSIIAKNINSGDKGKTPQFLNDRRQSILNSCYNKRKQQLVVMTKQNKKIYERINSQKSKYSSRELNKSYDSMYSSRVSNRSSRSRKSNYNRSSRGFSINGSRTQKGTLNNNQKQQPILVAHNINKINKEQIMNFNRIFTKPKDPLRSKPPLPTSKKLNCHNQNVVVSIIKQYPQQDEKTYKTNNAPDLRLSFKKNLTPQRPLKSLASNQCSADRYKKPSTSFLPSVKQNTPQRKIKLQKVIQDLIHKQRDNGHCFNKRKYKL